MNTPLHDYLLVELIPVKENKSAGGLFLPGVSEKAFDGKVIMAGPKVTHVKIGDVVRKFKNVPGISMQHEGKDCLFLREGSEIEFVNP